MRRWKQSAVVGIPSADYEEGAPSAVGRKGGSGVASGDEGS